MLETSHLKIATGVTSLEFREPPRATPIEGRRLLGHREDSAEEPTPEHGTGGSAHREIASGVTVRQTRCPPADSESWALPSALGGATFLCSARDWTPGERSLRGAKIEEPSQPSSPHRSYTARSNFTTLSKAEVGVRLGRGHRPALRCDEPVRLRQKAHFR